MGHRIELPLDEVEALAAQGLTHEQIALSLGVSETTLYKNKAELPEVAEAIKRGQAKGISAVTNALFESAKGGNLGAQVFYLKNRAGWADKTETDVTVRAPNEIKLVGVTSEDS